MDTGTNKTDIAVAIGRGVIGAVPFVGPLIAEVMSVLIPNQRIDRWTRFIEWLDQKVAGLEQQRVQQEFSRPEFIDLLEDGFVHASRALSDERLEYLASLLKNSRPTLNRKGCWLSSANSMTWKSSFSRRAIGIILRMPTPHFGNGMRRCYARTQQTLVRPIMKSMKRPFTTATANI
jgi:hypothetical protein